MENTSTTNTQVVWATGIALVAGLACSAHALDQGVKVGDGNTRVFTSVEGGLRYDDNFFRTANNEEGALTTTVAPEFRLQLLPGKTTTVNLGLEAEAGFIDTRSEDDYLDHRVYANIRTNPLTRHLLEGELSRNDGHDQFGLRRTEGTAAQNADLDQWHEDVASVLYRFGAPSARINVQVEAEIFQRQYETNRDQTQFLDFDRDTYTGTVFYNHSPKTTALLQYRHREIEYDDVRANVFARDGDEERLLVGLRWAATAKTVGDIRIGRVERDFDNNRTGGGAATPREDFEGTQWEVGISWSPKSYDTIRLSSRSDILESFIDQADFIESESTRLDWTHEWNSRLSTTAFGFLGTDTFENSAASFGGSDREDDVDGLGAEVSYEIGKSWLATGTVQFEDRDSNVDARDFDNTSYFIGLKFAP